MKNNFLGGLFGKIVQNAEGILDEVITTKEEKEQIKLELKKILLEAEQEAFTKEVEDRKDARSLYKDDSLIQKILATIFTAAYVVLSEYEIGFISTIFGAMSAKVNTIVDFFFGGSSKDNK